MTRVMAHLLGHQCKSISLKSKNVDEPLELMTEYMPCEEYINVENYKLW